MNKPISIANIRHFFTACPCGRTWETGHPLDAIPAHDHNQEDHAA